eukprot:gene29042-9065_t
MTVHLIHGRLPQADRAEAVEACVGDERCDRGARGRLPQAERAAAAAAFSSAAGPAALFTSDVGVPDDAAVHENRVGRTARAGRTGDACLLLRPADLPLLARLAIAPPPEDVTEPDAAQQQAAVTWCHGTAPPATCAARHAVLGSYLAHRGVDGFGAAGAVAAANEWATSLCGAGTRACGARADPPPALHAKMEEGGGWSATDASEVKISRLIQLELPADGERTMRAMVSDSEGWLMEPDRVKPVDLEARRRSDEQHEARLKVLADQQAEKAERARRAKKKPSWSKVPVPTPEEVAASEAAACARAEESEKFWAKINANPRVKKRQEEKMKAAAEAEEDAKRRRKEEKKHPKKTAAKDAAAAAAAAVAAAAVHTERVAPLTKAQLSALTLGELRVEARKWGVGLTECNEKFHVGGEEADGT